MGRVPLQMSFLGDLDARDDGVRLRVGPRDLVDVATGQSRGITYWPPARPIASGNAPCAAETSFANYESERLTPG